MEQKLTKNANYYPTKQAKITYIDSFVKYPALSYLAPRLKDNAINKFIIAEEMFEALQTAYRDTNKKHIMHIKFQNL